MLACPVIKRNSQLTDRLLRLLSLISLGQPDVLKRLDDPSRTEDSSEQSVLVDRMIRDEQIQLAVEVLTSKACSEEGLEDVTALLLNLSYGGSKTRESILHLLLAGARQLGNVVCSHVSDLLKELADLKTSGGIQHHLFVCGFLRFLQQNECFLIKREIWHSSPGDFDFHLTTLS